MCVVWGPRERERLSSHSQGDMDTCFCQGMGLKDTLFLFRSDRLNVDTPPTTTFPRARCREESTDVDVAEDPKFPLVDRLSGVDS